MAAKRRRLFQTPAAKMRSGLLNRCMRGSGLRQPVVRECHYLHCRIWNRAQEPIEGRAAPEEFPLRPRPLP
jgi:hypothetical protein